MVTRSILGLLYSFNRYKEMGLDPEPVFKQHGLSLDHIDENASIERSKELEIIIDLFRLQPNPVMGVSMGFAMGLAGYGPLPMLLMTCGNAYEACQMGVKYQELAYLFGEIKLELDVENSAIVLEPTTLPDEIAEFVLYRDIAGTLKFLQDIQKMNGVSSEIKEVCFTTPPPENTDSFKKIFNCPVRFNQPSNRLVIPTHLLKAPYAQANKTAFNIYKEQCDQQLKKVESVPDEISEQLARYLAMFVYKLPSVTEAAATFGFSERSFRRQLAKEETSYQKVLDKVRFDKAKLWLKESQINIDQIASKLGYQEAAAFNHAFKRWADCTPSQYRKTHSVSM